MVEEDYIFYPFSMEMKIIVQRNGKNIYYFLIWMENYCVVLIQVEMAWALVVELWNMVSEGVYSIVCLNGEDFDLCFYEVLEGEVFLTSFKFINNNEYKIFHESLIK